MTSPPLGQIGSGRQTLLTLVLMKVSHLRTELVVDALQMGVWHRRVASGLRSIILTRAFSTLFCPSVRD